MAAVLGCHSGPLPVECCNFLALPHLNDLAQAQLEGERLQHDGRILMTLKCLGMSCQLAFKTT